MVVFKYFFDKMDVFGPKMNEMAARIDREMENMEEVCLPVCPSPVYLCPLVYLPVSQSTCKLVSVMSTPFLSFTPRNLYSSPPSLTPSLVHSS